MSNFLRKFMLVQDMLSLPTPYNISIWWNWGSILGLLLSVQLVTGIFISMNYTADVLSAFSSVIHNMRDVPGGWFFRSLHANGASLFFIALYIHIGRGLYYQSFLTQPRVWMVGVSIYLICMGTAFLGYVLPWGQMSFWGATVITNLLSALPYWGVNLVQWVWGGFSVGQATLNRFFTLHFLLPFLITLLVLIHLIFLHEKGSTSPLGSLNHINKINFHPYFTIKDMVGFIMIMGMGIALVTFYPNLLGDPENYLKANPMVTPIHIQPEWYFLFAYAILRSIPSKIGGVIALVASIFVLYLLPLGLLKWSVPTAFSPTSQILFWMLVVTFIILTYLGACPVEAPYVYLSIVFTIFYFSLFFLYIISFIL
uniref:Cytochrome b n=1 Tax=Euphaedusa planostriata TaxID=2798995 RepID=A0A7T7D6R8_9EUPU|nr:cytochrome b [Euphaedusa planostriata]QQL04602.1 cytochrome b [Euphaedusa planostriata]